MRTKIFIIILAFMILGSGALVYIFSKEKIRSQNLSKNNEFIEEDGIVAGVSTDSSYSKDQNYIEELAKYMTDKGMVMYGAYWCPHCQDQKELFGSSFEKIDYVECDSQGPNANPDECQANGVRSYPTWIYEGIKYPGYKSLSELAEIVGFTK